MFSNARRTFASEYLIIRKSYKSQGIEIEKVFKFETLHSFIWKAKKALIKTWIKIFHCFHFESSTFETCWKKMTKAAWALGWKNPSSCVRYLARKHNCMHRPITRYDKILVETFQWDAKIRFTPRVNNRIITESRFKKFRTRVTMNEILTNNDLKHILDVRWIS